MSAITEAEDWFRDHFGKLPEEIKAGLETTKARLATLESYVKAAEPRADAILAALQKAVPVLDPGLGTELSAAVTAAEKADAVVKKVLADL